MLPINTKSLLKGLANDITLKIWKKISLNYIMYSGMVKLWPIMSSKASNEYPVGWAWQCTQHNGQEWNCKSQMGLRSKLCMFIT